MNIENCEYCTKDDTCKKSIGFMFGGCNIDYEDAEEVKVCCICGKIYCTDCGTLTEKGETCENCMD